MPQNPEPHAWRNPIVWALASGPLLVVVAGLITGWIAIVGADPVVQAPNASPASPAAPAVQARNHSATASPTHARP